jgi:RimJ/RimL family protein N-acetyltransferase
VDLIGARTILRPYRPTDAPAVWDGIQESRPSLVRWMPDIGRRETLAAVRAGLQQLCHARVRGDRLLYGVWGRRDRRFLGEVGLHDVDWARHACGVGYWLRVSARGQGYSAEGLGLLHGHAASALGLQRFEAHIAPENVPSRRVAERCGYVLTGERPADPHWDGDTDRVLIYARGTGRLELA